MRSRVETLQQEAKALFLGKGGVVGVGIADDTGSGKLVILLRQERHETRAEITGWANRNQIGVEFLLTGAVRVKDT